MPNGADELCLRDSPIANWRTLCDGNAPERAVLLIQYASRFARAPSVDYLLLVDWLIPGRGEGARRPHADFDEIIVFVSIFVAKRAVSHWRALYRKRFHVELFFHHLKRFRALATHYEKTARPNAVSATWLQSCRPTFYVFDCQQQPFNCPTKRPLSDTTDERLTNDQVLVEE